MGKSYKSHLKGCARYYPGGEQEETISAGYEVRVHLYYLQNERKAHCNVLEQTYIVGSKSRCSSLLISTTKVVKTWKMAGQEMWMRKWI